MVALGVAYMIFGNAIVDPTLKVLTADKQDSVSKSIMGVQVSLFFFSFFLSAGRFNCLIMTLFKYGGSRLA